MQCLQVLRSHPTVAVHASDDVTRVAMRNVDFYVDPQIVLHIRHLDGTMRSLRGSTILFDDKKSFVINIGDAEVGLTMPDLTVLLNKFVFNYPGAPLDRLVITTDGTQIIQNGRLRKGVVMPFTIHASVSVTPDGRIRLHPTYTRILGLHVDGLMRGLGMRLDKIIDLRGARGATVEGNDILLRPDSILPPPAIEGHVTGVRIEGGMIVQTFSGAGVHVRPGGAPANYMYYRGGTLRFGKLQMFDADMAIVDMDGGDPFKFDLDRYQKQLTAGYSRTLPSMGLEVHMRDVDKLDR